MLAYGHFPKCKVCGGQDAPIINDKHLSPRDCAKHLAEQLFFDFVKRHEQMKQDPVYFSKDNPTKQSYYERQNTILFMLTEFYFDRLTNTHQEGQKYVW